MKKIICEIIAFVLVVVMFFTITMHMGYIYMPERYDYGAVWNMYLEEKEDSLDIMFVGSSMAYCDVIPAEIYEKTGYTSYVVAAPYMMPSTTYYYLKEALRTQSPELIMLEATSFYFSLNEGNYHKVNVGYMPYSINRFMATFTAPKEEWTGLLFPLYNYHDKWEEYKLSDYFSPRPDKKTDIMAGCTLLKKTEPQGKMWEREFLVEEDELEENIHYMKKIIELCEKEKVDLEMFIVPACEYVSEELTNRLRDEAGDIKITNFTDNFEDIGLDTETHFYDKRHLNFKGAVLFSEYLADYITQNYELSKHAHDKALWAERIEYIKGKKAELE